MKWEQVLATGTIRNEGENYGVNRGRRSVDHPNLPRSGRRGLHASESIAQASTQLSPTAGWGIPVNATELLRSGEPETARMLISLSLAGTSFGRGTQTVGHADGIYRNRMTITLPP
jgi:hypothetical protein